MPKRGLALDIKGQEYKIPYGGIALLLVVGAIAFAAFFWKEDPELERGFKSAAELAVFFLSVVAGVVVAPEKSNYENEKAGVNVATEVFRLRGAMASRQIELESLLEEISPAALLEAEEFPVETVHLRIKQEVDFLNAARRDLEAQFPRLEKLAPTFIQDLKDNETRARQILEDLERGGVGRNDR